MLLHRFSLLLGLATVYLTISRVASAEAQTLVKGTDSPALVPVLAVTNESGKSIPLLSLEAYQAEFRYLKRKTHEVDLRAPAVATDGWTHNIAEAEWPFLAFCYFGYACANLATAAPQIRNEALQELQWLIEALQTPRMSGFVTPHFGAPFGKETICASVFVHGHFLNVCLRYREVSADARHNALIHRVAAALTNAYATSRAGVLKSYRDMWWISDNLPALSALGQYDRQFQTDTSAARTRFLQTAKDRFLDPITGLLATYVDADVVRILQGPRGISTMYGLNFLCDVSPEFSQDQYRRAHEQLIRETLGFAAVREFPPGAEGQPDIDSGPLVFGLGPSASGFAIAASAVNGDETTAKALLKASVLAGFPEFRSGELHYTMMPLVGQAVILFGKTELFKTQGSSATGR